MTEPQRDIEDEAPPALGAWPRVYALVCAYLACVILAFFWFTRTFAP